MTILTAIALSVICLAAFFIIGYAFTRNNALNDIALGLVFLAVGLTAAAAMYRDSKFRDACDAAHGLNVEIDGRPRCINRNFTEIAIDIDQ